MAIYTVHEPPLKKADAPREPEQFAFVRDGFYWWALLLTPIWLLYRRLWLAVVVYIAVAVGIGFALKAFGVSNVAMSVVQLLLSALVALEAATLLRRKLAWWRWNEVGLISAPRLEIAEQRFFDEWARALPREGTATAAASVAPAVAPVVAPARWARPQDDAVIGLFPQPGSPR